MSGDYVLLCMIDISQKIKQIESKKRVAFTKKYPIFLPFILKIKRIYNYVKYTYNYKYVFSSYTEEKMNNLVTHASPLYRKYNKEELDKGKIENIKIAIKNLDGLVIPPGKIFSFWKFIKQPSIERGFKKGLILSDGSLKEDIGGGLCQLSNLFAYMFACTECKFIERKHHSKDVFPDSGRTVPFASGATVFFNLIDLKVKNTYPFPIKINIRVTDTQLRGSISAPIQLDYYIKLEQKIHGFVRSVKTGKIYRYNELVRTFYKKHSKEKIKEEILWHNVADVMYDEKQIVCNIESL